MRENRIFCLSKNKGADQLCSNSCEAYQRLYFRYTDSTTLLLKSEISSYPFPVAAQAGLCQIWLETVLRLIYSDTFSLKVYPTLKLKGIAVTNIHDLQFCVNDAKVLIEVTCGHKIFIACLYSLNNSGII